MRAIPHLKVSSMADGCVNDLHWANILSFCVSNDWCPVFSGRGAALEGLDQFAEWCEGRMGTVTEEVMKLFWLKLPGKYEQRDECLKAAETRFYCL